ncbi:MAG: Do family serine endopeptidase, partial [Lysobacterales bacterium]
SRHAARTFGALALALALALSGCDRMGDATRPQQKAAANASRGSVPATRPTPYVRGSLPDFSALVESQGDAVVNIQTTRMLGGGRNENGPRGDIPDWFGNGQDGESGGNDDNESDPFRGLFPRFGQQHPPVPQQGAGSGFIISADGYVLTNAHVVDGSDTVIVKLTDRREYRAKVIGSDKRTDVALIKIDARDLPVVRLGSSSEVRVGEWVVAIGAPFGFENSVTAGIVSAKSRALSGDTPVSFLQTDVAVNPGNSGGPLFNLNGEVVGINSQIFSRSGGYQGISFAIPIDVAINVRDQLLETGTVSHGRIGAVIQQVTQELADSFGLSGPNGALVAQVVPGGAADRAGLREGDVILRVGDVAINESGQVPAIVSAMRPGTRTKLAIQRDGKPRELDIEIGAAEDDAPALAARGKESEQPAAQLDARLGLRLRPLVPAEARRLNVEGGMRIEKVNGNGQAAGLRPGDIVLRINGVPALDMKAVQAEIADSDDHVALLIEREGQRSFVPLRVAPAKG